MKRVWQHPEEPKTGKRYWRSLGEVAKTPRSQEWQEREFPDGVAEMKDEADAESSRRTFLKLMGASTALAGMGLASCRRPELHVKPYSRSPEWIIPGKALYYATSMPRLGGAVPLTVTTYEGRPTHLAGNALHPESNGGLDAITQATILDLYSPSRAKSFKLTGGHKAGKDAREGRSMFFKFIDDTKAEAAKSGGKGLAILTDGVASPTRARLIGEILTRFPQAKLYRHEAVNQDAVANVYAKLSGPGAMPVYHLDKAARVFSLDCDFLGLDRIGTRATSQFMSGRKAETPADGAKMNRLYAAESTYSLTGGMADHRLRVPASRIMHVAVALGKALGVKEADAVTVDAGWTPRADFAAWIKEAAADLKAAAGKAVVLAGARQPEAVQALVAAINVALNAYGSVIEVKNTGAAPAGSLAALATAANAGEVSALFIFGDIDPVFEAPADIKFAEGLKKVKDVVVHSTRHKTATSRAASWSAPGTHYLEQWSDALSAAGVYSVVQPMILPLFTNCVSDIEVLLALNSPEPTPDYVALAEKAEADAKALILTNMPAAADPGIVFKAVRETFNKVVPGASDDVWNFTLRDGFAKGTSYAAAPAPNPAAAAEFLKTFKEAPVPSVQAMEVVFQPCSKIWDGRHVNNGWLQEAPDPVSKVTWDNAALISVKTAKALEIDLKLEDSANLISVTVNGATRYYPVLVIPGHADDVVTLTVGYGQAGVDESGPGQVGQLTGFDAYGLRSSASPYIATGAVVKKVTEDVKEAVGTGLKEIPAIYPLGTTQEHHNMMGRALVREGNTEDWTKNEDFVLTMGTDAHVHGTREEKKAYNQFSLYKQEGRKDENGNAVPLLSDKLHQWGMAIDLNSCTGCTSCLVACQSENNIPIVGKDQVRKGREMHWIRMDRYFATDLNSDSSFHGREWEPKAWEEDFMDDPEMVVQPVGCQHCQAAPCETVCPVNATVHSSDGLNVMVYNRCIGTRYCANNCPFKARRFNFFDYSKRNPLAESKFGLESNLYDGPFGEKHDTELSKLQKNPNVSVRMRGVIEKCTYCVQRIEAARIETAAQGRKAAALKSGAYDENIQLAKEDLRVKDLAIRTACQVACPADAIMFGNVADEKSTVSLWKNNRRNYEMLGYLGVVARTTYLARIKNPNPALLASSEIEKKKVGKASTLQALAHH